MNRLQRLASACALATLATTALSQGSGRDRLRDEIERLSAIGGGMLGVAATHLETGRAISVNGDERFPMASTYKVPIATRILKLVDDGKLTLDKMVGLEPDDLHPGSGTLTRLFDDPGVELSLRNLLELMLLISDNSATDLVLEQAGGGEAVTAHMQAIGVDGIRVDRPTLQLIGNWAGVPDPASGQAMTLRGYRQGRRRLSAEERKAAAAAFDTDPRDTATPDGMVELLELIWKGGILSEANTALLLDIMYRCETGAGRIKGLLPPRTRVAHKTGTIGGTTNDIGIVDLPHDAGHVALAVFIKSSTRDAAQRELAIAQVSRAIYDYFLFVDG